jgi:hypothetical protein
MLPVDKQKLKEQLKRGLIEQGNYAPLLRGITDASEKELLIKALIEKGEYEKVYNIIISDEESQDIEQNKHKLVRNVEKLLKKEKKETQSILETALKTLKREVQSTQPDIEKMTKQLVSAIASIPQPKEQKIDVAPIVEAIRLIPQTPRQEDYAEYFMRLEAVMDTVRTAVLESKVSVSNNDVVSTLERVIERLERPLIFTGGGANTAHLLSESAYNKKQDALISAIGSIGGAYNLKKFAYNVDADLEYQGKNVSDTASDSDTDWEITKYIYVDGTNTESITKTGSWTGRVALFT